MRPAEEFRDHLVSACEAAVLEGWTFRCNVTMDPQRRECCALGAHARAEPNYTPLLDAGRLAGLEDSETEAFIAGFASDAVLNPFAAGSWESLGYEIAAQFGAT